MTQPDPAASSGSDMTHYDDINDPFWEPNPVKVQAASSAVHDRGWQRCHSCGKTWLHGHSRERDPDIKSLFYTRSDGVKGSSYPMCAEHRPEQITRLERMGFYDIEVRP